MKNQSQVNFFAQLYNITPYWMQNWLTSLKKVPTFFQWWLHPYGRKHTSSILAPYKNKYIGCRCVIIGNGPSLRKMDLSLLKNEFTFGLNRIYLLYDELGFETTFLVAVNRFVLDQFSNDLQKLPNLKILNWSYRKPFQINEKVIFLHPKIRRTTDGNILNGNYPGTGTVTNVALEIAFFMGFSEVILIGVDHSFVEKGTGNQAVVSSGADQNHFSPEYFGKGVVWQLPDYVAMERGYSRMKELFEMDGRRVVDATKGGNLQIFPKVSFGEYLKMSKYTKNTKNIK